MTKILFLFSFLVLSGGGWNSWADEAPSSVPVSIEGDSIPKKTKELVFTVPADHHFNQQAPNKIEMIVNGSWKQAASLKLDKTRLTATWDQEGIPCSGLRSVLYVCDDKNTYCIPHGQSYQCDGDRWTAKEWNPPNFQADGDEVKPGADFIVNDSEGALKEAKETHRPLLIDFYGIWCPPCNQLDETVFSSPQFGTLKDKFVLLKLDADSPASWDFKSKYKIGGYPTVVFANSDGEEISRIVGARENVVFVSQMRSLLKRKDESLAKKKELADGKDGSTAAYEVGLIYLERAEFAQAHYYLYVASRSWPLSDIRRNKLLSADLGLQSHPTTDAEKQTYAKFLWKALDWYPRQPEVFDRAAELSRVAGELGDKETENKGYRTEVETAQWYLGHPKAMKQTDFSRGDLYELIGDTYDSMSDTAKSQEAYKHASEEYLADINRAKLDPETERGFNLERLYCLWKSGQKDEAQRLYAKMEELYPTEFTFFYQHGRLLNDSKDFKTAEEKALKAFEFSYGDNKLRSAGLLAEIYENESKKDKALDVVSKTLDKFTLPDDKSIRTYRYYDKLVQMKTKLKGS